MSLTRRSFLSRTAAGLVSARSMMSSPHDAASRVVGANDRVRIGVIGTGRQGRSDMRAHLALSDVEIAGVCDVYAPNLAEGLKAAPSAKTYADFRRMLDDKSIDAVIIGTPDHWHALMTVMACQAGKDVYVEKPTSVAIAEGRKMVQAARKYNRIVQVGTQQRSASHFQEAVKLVWDGRLGDISAVRMWNVGNQAPYGIGSPLDSDPPAGLDWDMWLGPAPKRPFNANRFGVVPENYSYFRWFWDYAGGMMTDWGVHLIDIVQWAMKVNAPLSVSAVGGHFCLKDNRETPDTIIATYQFPGFVLTYENRTGNARGVNGHEYGIEFYGIDGTLFVDRSGFELTPETRKSATATTNRTEPASRTSTLDNPTHARNFVDAIKSRQPPICDIEIGHRSTSTAILGNMAYRSGATVVWDAAAETVTNDNARATALVDRAYRSPWALTV
jgi:predicted dehydrogenase